MTVKLREGSLTVVVENDVLVLLTSSLTISFLVLLQSLTSVTGRPHRAGSTRCAQLPGVTGRGGLRGSCSTTLAPARRASSTPLSVENFTTARVLPHTYCMGVVSR